MDLQIISDSKLENNMKNKTGEKITVSTFYIETDRPKLTFVDQDPGLHISSSLFRHINR